MEKNSLVKQLNDVLHNENINCAKICKEIGVNYRTFQNIKKGVHMSSLNSLLVFLDKIGYSVIIEKKT